MENMTTVSFPGLGIGEFSFSRVAFELFGKPVYWYGVIILCGILAAFAHAMWRAGREGVSRDDLLDLTIFTVLFGVLGARLYYVATTWGNYDSFLDVIAIWNGGLAIYGGIIAGALTIYVVCRIKKINPLKVMDMVAPGVMLAQAIGRWGNFCNGEAFGEVVSAESWLYPFRMGLISEFTGKIMQYYHPTFLYESLWNLIGFTCITAFYKRKAFNGQILLSYLTWYGFGRMFIEGLRTDSLYVGSLRISQVVGFVCFLVGGALLIACLLLQRKGKLPPVFEVQWACVPDTAGAAATITMEKECTAPAENPAQEESHTQEDNHTQNMQNQGKDSASDTDADAEGDQNGHSN